MAALIATLLLIAAPPSVALAESPSPRVPGAGHGIQAQAPDSPASQKNTRKSFGLLAAVHARPLMKKGFVHASLSIVRAETTETDAVP